MTEDPSVVATTGGTTTGSEAAMTAGTTVAGGVAMTPATDLLDTVVDE